MTAIGILGAAGRMGIAITEAGQEREELRLVGGIDRDGPIFGAHADAAALASACDVLIDFSTPAALARHLAVACDADTPILIGTTGITGAQHIEIDAAANRVAVLQSANMSLGVNLLAHLVREAASRLGPDWDIEVLEMHHRYKLDAPSGTALLLGAAAAEGRGDTLEALSRYQRFDTAARRETGTIGYAALRGGSVAGDHQLIFATEGERIELGHRAESRAIFARGALKGALWLADRPPGRYGMQDVLGIV